jgi:hypothetical protein
VNAVGADQKRQYFRLQLDPPLCSDMTIVMVKGKTLEIGSAEVLIEDIGPGGLRFLSHLSLPVNPQVVLQFETEILKQRVSMHGYVVRKNQWSEGIHEYGVAFTVEEGKRVELAQIINLLAIRMRQHLTTPSGRFLMGDRLAFLQHRRQLEQDATKKTSSL